MKRIICTLSYTLTNSEFDSNEIQEFIKDIQCGKFQREIAEGRSGLKPKNVKAHVQVIKNTK